MSEPTYLWLDMETTGLNDLVDRVLEIGWVTTGADLELRHTVREYLVGHAYSESPLELMSPEVKAMHDKSGLTRDWIKGGRRRRDEIERMIFRDLPAEGPVYLAGSGVHFDRRFIDLYFTQLADRLHYRLVDVSVTGRFLSEVCGLELMHRETAHRAGDDVVQAIERAREYRALILNQPTFDVVLQRSSA
jgi:oligoribonuclease